MAVAGTSAAVESPRERVELALEGMTCASCAARIEQKLNRLDGVEATVNLATERAAVTFDPAQVEVAALIATVEQTGYGAEVAHTQRGTRDDGLAVRLLASLALTVPTALLASIPALQFAGWTWVAFVLSTPVVLWCGWRFHRAALSGARQLAATMDTLISLGTLAAWGWSTVVLLGGLDEDVYFEVAAVITTLVLLGRYVESRARRRSGDAIRALLELGARDARVLRGGAEVLVPVDALQVGDLYAVRPGERLAADGVVVEGTSALDQSLLTGESVPVEVEPGSEVVGATVNTYGRLVVRATRVGADTALAQIARLVEQAQTGKAPVQRLADRVAAVFVPTVIALALATFVGWLLAGSSAAAG